MKPIIRIGTPLRSIFKNGGMKGMGSSMYIRMVEMAAKTPISVTIRVLDRRGSWLFCGSVLVFVIEYIPFSMPAAAGKFDREGLSVLGKGIKNPPERNFRRRTCRIRAVSLYRTLPLVWDSHPVCRFPLGKTGSRTCG